jgi:intergrase/recombinase
MLPIVLEMRGPEGWTASIIKFAEGLMLHFGKRLKRVIALPSPDDQVYDSNVLVVIEKPTLDDVKIVMELAVRSGERLNPLVVDEGDEEAVRIFMSSFQIPKADWNYEHVKFAEGLMLHFGKRLKRVIALPSPDDQVYDSNVLVVIEKPTLDDVKIVMELAVRSGERLNPLVVDEGDEEAVRIFMSSGGRDVEAR